MSEVGPTLPNELVQIIVDIVIVDGIHLAALSIDEHDWELNMFRTLSSVSYMFHYFTRQIAAKAFALSESNNLLSVAESKVRFLHADVVDRAAKRSPGSFNVNQGSSNLCKSYLLFTAIRQLWHNWATDARIYALTENCIQAACGIVLQVCNEKENPAARRLARSVRELSSMAGSARLLVGVCEALDDSLLQFQVAAEGDARQTLETAIHLTIDMVVATELNYSEIEQRNIVGLDKALTPVAKLPLVSSTVSRLLEGLDANDTLQLLQCRVSGSVAEERKSLTLEECLRTVI